MEKATPTRRVGRRRGKETEQKCSTLFIMVIVIIILSMGVFISVALHLHFDVGEHVKEDGHAGQAKDFPFLFSNIKTFEDEVKKEALVLEKDFASVKT